MSHIGPLDPVAASLVGRCSLSDLLWVANTGHGPGAHWHARPGLSEHDHDHLEAPADAVRYLVDHQVSVPGGAPTAGQLASLAEVRRVVRGLADAPAVWTPAARILLQSSRYSVTEDGGLVAEGPGWDAFVSDLLIPLMELIHLRARLAACANPACRLLFLDNSRNQTRRWCDDGGCGNRARARAYRVTHSPGHG